MLDPTGSRSVALANQKAYGEHWTPLVGTTNTMKHPLIPQHLSNPITVDFRSAHFAFARLFIHSDSSLVNDKAPTRLQFLFPLQLYCTCMSPACAGYAFQRAPLFPRSLGTFPQICSVRGQKKQRKHKLDKTPSASWVWLGCQGIDAADTAEMRSFCPCCHLDWVSGYCTKWRIQGQFS